MPLTSAPLVSCIMPTQNRRQFVSQALTYFMRQDYPNLELVIGNEGEVISDLIKSDDPKHRIELRTFKAGQTLGTKRNNLVEAAAGDLICLWDDDDWHGPHRISQQVASLLSSSAPVCGFDPVLFFDVRTGNSWCYKFGGDRPYLYGGSLLYTREFWRQFPFPDQQVASTTAFTWGHDLSRAKILDGSEADFVAIAHESNTSRKCFCGPYYTQVDPVVIKNKLGDDWPLYGGTHV